MTTILVTGGAGFIGSNFVLDWIAETGGTVEGSSLAMGIQKRPAHFGLRHKHKGMIRFYRKFFGHQYPWPLLPLVVAAVWTRFLLLADVALYIPPGR